MSLYLHSANGSPGTSPRLSWAMRLLICVQRMRNQMMANDSELSSIAHSESPSLWWRGIHDYYSISKWALCMGTGDLISVRTGHPSVSDGLKGSAMSPTNATPLLQHTCPQFSAGETAFEPSLLSSDGVFLFGSHSASCGSRSSKLPVMMSPTWLLPNRAVTLTSLIGGKKSFFNLLNQ